MTKHPPVRRKFNIGDTAYYISQEEIIETRIKSFKRLFSTGVSYSKNRAIKANGVSYEYTDINGNRFEEWFLFKNRDEAQTVFDSYKKRIESFMKNKIEAPLTPNEMTTNDNIS